MSARKHRLIDCNPRWVRYDGRDGTPDALSFDCPVSGAELPGWDLLSPEIKWAWMAAVDHTKPRLTR